MKKVRSIKWANSVKCGPGEHTSANERSPLEVWLVDPVTFLVKCTRTQRETHTTLFNTCWYMLEDQDTLDDLKALKGAKHTDEPLPVKAKSKKGAEAKA